MQTWPSSLGGTSPEYECAAGTRSLSEDSRLEASIPPEFNVQTFATCCSATQPMQPVHPAELKDSQISLSDARSISVWISPEC